MLEFLNNSGYRMLMPLKRILITGGAGFIGSHLAEALVADGKEVAVIDDLSTGALANIAALLHHPRFHFFQASIRDARALAQALEGVDFIYHLAAAVGVELVVKSPVYTIEANVRGTEDVLAAAARTGCGIGDVHFGGLRQERARLFPGSR